MDDYAVGVIILWWNTLFNGTNQIQRELCDVKLLAHDTSHRLYITA